MPSGRGWANAPWVERIWVNYLSITEQARLFKPFTRLDPAQVSGHGLGLSIVQRLVKALGGCVGVESEGCLVRDVFSSSPCLVVQVEFWKGVMNKEQPDYILVKD